VKDHWFDYCIASAWENKDTLVDRLFCPDMFKKPIDLNYFDLPELHLNTKIGQLFWYELGKSDETDIFDTKAIQILISYKWRGIQYKVFRRYLIPYVLFILIFTIWSNVFYEQRNGEDVYFYGQLGISGLLILSSLYFMWAELIQLRIAGVKFFYDPWNYIDIFPLILMMTITSWTSYDAVTVRYFNFTDQNYIWIAVRDWI